VEISKFNIVPNKVAAAYIRGRAAISPGAFGRLPDALKARAFTVARIEDVRVLADIREAVARIPEGGDWKKTRNEIARLIAGDEDAGRGHKARANLVMRVNTKAAYAAARHADQVATADIFPYWMYMCNLDGRERASHAKLNGLILRHDHPFWKDHYPPWEWGCRCKVTKITEAEAANYGVADARTLKEILEGLGDDGDGFNFNPFSLAIDLNEIINSLDDPSDRDFERTIFAVPEIPLAGGTQSAAEANDGGVETGAFAPAKTVGEARKFALEHIADKLDIPASFKDLKLLNRLNNAITLNLKKFGLKKFKGFNLADKGEGRAWVERAPSDYPKWQSLGVNQVDMNRLAEEHREGVVLPMERGDRRFHAVPKDATEEVVFQHTIDHEFGHAVFNQSKLKNKVDLANAVYRRVNMNREWDMLSKYAEKNGRELFAEAFAMHQRGDILPKHIVDFIKEVTDAI